MNTVITLLDNNPQVSDYKINIHKKESYELFFVKGKLETVRCTDTCDKEVTVYADHDGCKGDAQFFIYPSTTEVQVKELIEEAVSKALLIYNQNYFLPEQETGAYAVQSNFSDFDPADLAAHISKAVFAVNTVDNTSLNSVEIFINKHTETVLNSRGLNKTQVRYDAMVEAIPTYNGSDQSVELYEQYNFSTYDPADIAREISEKMLEVKARYEAVKPDYELNCPVILNKQELSQLMRNIAGDLNYASVHSHSNLFHKGDAIQKSPVHDAIGITMIGEIPGSTRSAKFDSDGVSLGSIRIVENGKAVNYYGSNRYGQYLGENPTGELMCMIVDPGSAESQEFHSGPYLEVISMSGLQVDFYSDYIGGEIRLAYYHDGSNIIPVTGVSISGKLEEVLNTIHLSIETASANSYCGPKQAQIPNMKIF